MNQKRIRTLKEGTIRPGPVVFWMSRDQRVRDNWALLFAQELARTHKKPLVVVFCLAAEFLDATTRQYRFMLKGLQEVEKRLKEKNVPFILLTGSPEEKIPRFIRQCNAGVLVRDFDPLKIKRRWADAVSRKIAIPFYEVDAHNIVPCWVASPKQEYGAYTIRPKIKRALQEFLSAFPRFMKHPFTWKNNTTLTDWPEIIEKLRVDNIPEVDWINPGEKAASRMLRNFIKNRLPSYATRRNDPALDAQSNLSPYLHFGHISAQRVALEVMNSGAGKTTREAFLEELIVRRELSDNFCFYTPHYDTCEGFPQWAKKTLQEHRKDRRPYLYRLAQFENAETHDDLWNAAQTEMVFKGKMHVYMRMYWAKKILEWTKSPEEAMEIAIYLNDRYELDGRDPNGYTGIAWSIGGVHDRAWNERPVFGKIRYMSYNGCRAKFNIKKYIQQVRSLI
ncbi:MAG: deoxyribodipyrimidine photo-lyase [Nitrospirota bacterium]